MRVDYCSIGAFLSLLITLAPPVECLKKKDKPGRTEVCLVSERSLVMESVSIADTERCQQYCDLTDSCVYWTWYKRHCDKLPCLDDQHTKLNVCYLLSSCSLVTHNCDGCSSGSKMEVLVEQISRVQEGELGVAEFQVAVLSALLNIMRDQESLNKTLAEMTEEKQRMKLEREEDIFSDSSASDESEQSIRRRAKYYKSDETQTNQNTTILYYHERKKYSIEDTTPLLEEEEEEESHHLEEDKVTSSQYRWKRRIPADRFGAIIKAHGQYQEDLISSRSDTEHSSYSREHQNEAKKKLEQILGVEISPGRKFVEKNNKYLVTVPDGLIGEDKLVQIQCPHNCSRNETLAVTSMESLAKSDVGFCLSVSGEGRLRLREDHEFYFQVQGELNITKRQLCYFVVWSPSEFHYEVIQRDEHFWDLLMYPWLLDFHRKFILEDRWKIPDIGEEEMSRRSEELWAKLKLRGEADQRGLERRTRGQGRNSDWSKERRERLTASNFGRVVKMRSGVSCRNTVMAILYPERLDNIESIRYAKEKEKEAVATLSAILAERGAGKVEPCGLFVDTEKSFLAASPDGLVGEEAVVEVKCPLVCADRSLQWLATHDPSFCLQRDLVSGGLRLRRTHDYYYQIQGQMHISRRAKCYFMVWSPVSYHLELVSYDPQFWEEIGEILDNFYINCLLPELLDPRAPRGQPLREPDYVLHSQNLRNIKI